MSDEPIFKLADIASEAHANIQRDFADIDPVIGISRSMRQSGFAADAMTIDCLKSGKRIILVLHDDLPGILRYQFSLKEADPGSDFTDMDFEDVSAQTLYDWVVGYFSRSS